MGYARAIGICRMLGWLTAKLLLLFLLTGDGVTEFQTVTPLTLGLLTKPLALQLHSVLVYPLVAILALHLSASFMTRRNLERKAIR